MSDSSLPELIGQIMHFIEFAVLAFLLFYALYHDEKTITRKSILNVIMLTMLYALSDEIHQLFVPGRTFQVIDLFIDFIGAITGVFLYKKMMFIKPKEKTA